jgi:heme/copper-type cytochrome/quinol oxidase subunit 2
MRFFRAQLKRQAGIAALVALVALTIFAPLPAWGAHQVERQVTVTARSFAFEPETVRVNRGDTVVIRLESADVVHGLFVDGYEVSALAEPGRPSELRFVANRPGAFRMRCSISCGNMHPFMIGKLVVGPNLLWLRAIAATLVTVAGALVLFWNRKSV